MAERECAAGKLFCASALLCGCVEVDATSIGKFVSQHNKEYADMIWTLQKKTGLVHAAYPCHVRVLGLRQRNGDVVICVLRPQAGMSRT